MGVVSDPTTSRTCVPRTATRERPHRREARPSLFHGNTDSNPVADANFAYNHFVAKTLPASLEVDPVIEVYKKNLDYTRIDEALKLTPEERLRALEKLQRFAQELRSAGRRSRGENG